MYRYCLVKWDPLNTRGFVASHWFGEYVSSFCSPQGFFGFSSRYLAVSQVIAWLGKHSLFTPAAGERPKETKRNLMDCICLCSEVEISNDLQLLEPKEIWYLESDWCYLRNEKLGLTHNRTLIFVKWRVLPKMTGANHNFLYCFKAQEKVV